MSAINRKQAEFSLHVARLIVWGHDNGVPCLGAEWHRSVDQAAKYAKSGAGISNSLHILKLALDIFCLGDDGAVTWKLAPYQILGDKWKTMHRLARWGGDFESGDSVHFSFEHDGVK